jgi:hypothetical protein
MAKSRWSDLSTGQKRSIVAGAAIEVVVTAAAVCDLYRRPRELVRGSRALWLLSFVVQPFGPMAYFVLGRRPGE